jgi:hypothetical protein
MTREENMFDCTGDRDPVKIPARHFDEFVEKFSAVKDAESPGGSVLAKIQLSLWLGQILPILKGRKIDFKTAGLSAFVLMGEKIDHPTDRRLVATIPYAETYRVHEEGLTRSILGAELPYRDHVKLWRFIASHVPEVSQDTDVEWSLGVDSWTGDLHVYAPVEKSAAKPEANVEANVEDDIAAALDQAVKSFSAKKPEPVTRVCPEVPLRKGQVYRHREHGTLVMTVVHHGSTGYQELNGVDLDLLSLTNPGKAWMVGKGFDGDDKDFEFLGDFEDHFHLRPIEVRERPGLLRRGQVYKGPDGALYMTRLIREPTGYRDVDSVPVDVTCLTRNPGNSWALGKGFDGDEFLFVGEFYEVFTKV